MIEAFELKIRRQRRHMLGEYSDAEAEAKALKDQVEKAGSNVGNVALAAIIAGGIFYVMFGGRRGRSLTA